MPSRCIRILMNACAFLIFLSSIVCLMSVMEIQQPAGIIWYDSQVKIATQCRFLGIRESGGRSTRKTQGRHPLCTTQAPTPLWSATGTRIPDLWTGDNGEQSNPSSINIIFVRTSVRSISLIIPDTERSANFPNGYSMVHIEIVNIYLFPKLTELPFGWLLKLKRKRSLRHVRDI